MIEWTDEDVQAARTALYNRSHGDVDATDDEVIAALDAALASAQKREVASVPVDEVEAFDAGAQAWIANGDPDPGWKHAAIVALDAHRAKHAKPAPQIPDGWVPVMQALLDAYHEDKGDPRMFHNAAKDARDLLAAAPKLDPREQALDRMAENARELGLDYSTEPAKGKDHE